MSLPFRAGDMLRQAYRAVVDGRERAPVATPPVKDGPSSAAAAERPAREASVHRSSGTRIVTAKPHGGSPPMIDLAALLPSGQLARVHPHVREFYAHPSAFDVMARLRMPPFVEQLVRSGLPVSPLYALGLVGARESEVREYPVTMKVHRGEHDQVRWDRFLHVDGVDVPLFTGHVAVVDGHLRESLDGHGPPVTIDLRARAEGDGVRFDLVRATPSWLFATVRIAYVTLPTAQGIRTVGSYRHRLLRVEGTLELEGVLRASGDAAPAASVTPLACRRNG